MKKIVMNGYRYEKLQNTLDVVQKGCTARLLSCEKIDNILAKAASKMNISTRCMKGTKLIYNGAEHFPASYGYRPESTHFEAEHNGRHWVITSIERKTCPNRLDNTLIHLSPLSSQAVLDSFNSVRL